MANRNGGVVKVFSQHEDCDPNKNGMPGLQTSTDWFVPFDYTTQRPVAWAPGILDQGSCLLYHDEHLWPEDCKPGQDSVVKVSLIEGDSGDIEFTVDMPGRPRVAIYGRPRPTTDPSVPDRAVAP